MKGLCKKIIFKESIFIAVRVLVVNILGKNTYFKVIHINFREGHLKNYFKNHVNCCEYPWEKTFKISTFIGLNTLRKI